MLSLHAFVENQVMEVPVLCEQSLKSVTCSEEFSSLTVQSSPTSEIVSLPSFVSDFSDAVSSCSSVEFSLPSDSDTESLTDWSDVEGILSDDEDASEEHVDDPGEQTSGVSNDVFTTPLYHGSKLTIFDSFLLILQFALR